MSKEYKGLTIEITADTSKFEESVNDISKSLDKLMEKSRAALDASMAMFVSRVAEGEATSEELAFMTKVADVANGSRTAKARERAIKMQYDLSNLISAL